MIRKTKKNGRKIETIFTGGLSVLSLGLMTGLYFQTFKSSHSTVVLAHWEF